MKIILASKSGVRKEILQKNNISADVIVSGIDEEQAKDSFLYNFIKHFKKSGRA